MYISKIYKTHPVNVHNWSQYILLPPKLMHWTNRVLTCKNAFATMNLFLKVFKKWLRRTQVPRKQSIGKGPYHTEALLFNTGLSGPRVEDS